VLFRSRDPEFSLADIDIEDEKTYRLLSRGDSTGVFQLESSGMKELLTKLKPETFEDIIALLALYRPGPLTGGLKDAFVRRWKEQDDLMRGFGYEVVHLDESYPAMKWNVGHSLALPLTPSGTK